jgi:hypothetical protein
MTIWGNEFGFRYLQCTATCVGSVTPCKGPREIPEAGLAACQLRTCLNVYLSQWGIRHFRESCFPELKQRVVGEGGDN